MIRKYRTEIEQYLKSLIEQESMKRQEIQQKLDLKVNYCDGFYHTYKCSKGGVVHYILEGVTGRNF